MAKLTLSTPLFGARSLAPEGERPVTSVAFDGVMVALAAWFIGGLFLDGWAHQHVAQLETFFTPWHAVLYSGFFVSALFVFASILWNVRRGYQGLNAIPIGYELSALGVLIFSAGGLADMVWHILFGIEANVEALLSPTHLILASGMALILTGPLRAAWLRSDVEAKGWAAQSPMVLSLTFLLSLLAFFTQYIHPFTTTWAAWPHHPQAATFGVLTQGGVNRIVFYEQAIGLGGILLQSAVLMGVVLLAVRRWTLPFGSVTLAVGLSTVLLTVMRDRALGGNPLDTGLLPLVAVAVLGGQAADLMAWRLRPSAARPAAFRAFAFAVPAILYGLYFAALLLFGGGIWWTVHLWAGAVVLAGVVGLLLSYAFIPPYAAADPERAGAA